MEEEIKSNVSGGSDEFFKIFNRQKSLRRMGFQSISGHDVELEPNEQKVIRVIPTVTPFFEPARMRFHGRRVSDGQLVPYAVTNAFCGDRMLFGESLDEIFSHQVADVNPQKTLSPQELINKLNDQIEVLTKHGRSGLAALRERDDDNHRTLNPKGMLTSILSENNGWCDILGWPIFSTPGLGAVLGIVVHNPWPFRIRASITMEGNVVTSHDKESGESESTEHKRIDRVFGTAVIYPKTAGVCFVTPKTSPFFDPRRCKIACVDLDDPKAIQDIKIGAVTIGGSPQLGINVLTPDYESPGIRPDDIDLVNWSVFSSIGLSRELQMSLFNMCDRKIAVFVCVEGQNVQSLECYKGVKQNRH